MVSFVIPAHNEAAWIVRTFGAIRSAVESVEEPYEMIVVDDASTDETARLARDAGASVVQVSHRQIAATRNSGARMAQGDVLFFVDADTVANLPGTAVATEGETGWGACCACREFHQQIRARC